MPMLMHGDIDCGQKSWWTRSFLREGDGDSREPMGSSHIEATQKVQLDREKVNSAPSSRRAIGGAWVAVLYPSREVKGKVRNGMD